MSTSPMRPTSHKLSRRAKNRDADWMMDRRTAKRVNRKTDRRRAIAEAMGE